ncbi:hypothetical protein, unlikely [Trypanosoma brucei gambiense DAL972]|uniref:Uncharacterized protein n=1 Tax=Trypanosoma brucei gambiense (strain MHOM/CI/86/DAL972) TaxID=679716 RepID=D0A222_TRYB9|nr:hypothetical protein, unlikely [Trypanosoma brucei gambiense DAL972]CBH15315.1 hypothetical protein, unlikely [Trypanosoma brucei gambiense DAL972]|eukprot:XP_011777580.1 hypothetical protein, unlikely [Trypanosoma brucei gambiense DAL972]
MIILSFVCCLHWPCRRGGCVPFSMYISCASLMDLPRRAATRGVTQQSKSAAICVLPFPAFFFYTLAFRLDIHYLGFSLGTSFFSILGNMLFLSTHTAPQTLVVYCLLREKGRR